MHLNYLDDIMALVDIYPKQARRRFRSNVRNMLRDIPALWEWMSQPQTEGVWSAGLWGLAQEAKRAREGSA